MKPENLKPNTRKVSDAEKLAMGFEKSESEVDEIRHDAMASLLWIMGPAGFREVFPSYRGELPLPWSTIRRPSPVPNFECICGDPREVGAVPIAGGVAYRCACGAETVVEP